MNQLFDLNGRVALVTGGSSGIGEAIASALADAGAAVVLCARSARNLDVAAERIETAGGRAAALSADVGELDSLSTIARDAAEPFGAPDILVNAAGVNLREAYADITIESWEETLGLNLSAPYFLARELLPAMQDRSWGKIINIASLQSVRAFPNSVAYGASKGGVCQLTRAMAEAWSADGINCNAIAPGFFPTRLTSPVFDDPEREAWAARQTAMGRNGRLEDLHGVAVFLASHASDYITGQTLFVDGGFTAK